MINRPLVNEPAPMQDNPRRGILLMIATTIIFAAQDGISRYLAGSYDIITIVAIRYWFFALFVCAFSARKSGEFKRAATNSQPWLQAGRGVFWSRKYVWPFLALARWDWYNFMLFLPANL